MAPAIARVGTRLLAPIVRLLFRPTLTGVEHLPTDRPYLLVANHSAGLAAAEVFAFAACWLTHPELGVDRPIAGFAHPAGFVLYPISQLMPAVGAIPSTYAHAHRTLARGIPILVFPGGDHEALRPIWLANRVDFGGRQGFLRIAREARVPIVPMGIRGAHWTAPMLVRSRWLATILILPRLLFSQRRWGISVFGLAVAVLIATLAPWAPWVRALVAFLWLGSPLAFSPWIPATIRMRIGPRVEADALFSRDAGDDPKGDDLVAALARVEREVQRLVDR